MESMQIRALIVGAGSAGIRVFHALDDVEEGQRGWVPIGFIDDDSSKIGSLVCGLPVFGNRLDIPKVVTKHRISVVVIALPSAAPQEICKTIEICNKIKVQIKILPRTYIWVFACPVLFCETFFKKILISLAIAIL